MDFEYQSPIQFRKFSQQPNPNRYYDYYNFRLGKSLGERLGALVKTGALDVGYVKTTLLKTTRPCTLDNGAGFWVPWNGDDL